MLYTNFNFRSAASLVRDSGRGWVRRVLQEMAMDDDTVAVGWLTPPRQPPRLSTTVTKVVPAKRRGATGYQAGVLLFVKCWPWRAWIQRWPGPDRRSEIWALGDYRFLTLVIGPIRRFILRGLQHVRRPGFLTGRK